jgi:hypothetical protein
MSDRPVPFPDQYKLSKYPFTDTSIMASTDGALLPSSFFRDAAVYVNGTDGTISLRSIVITDDVITVNLGTASDPAKYTGSFVLNTENEIIELRDKYLRCCGFLLHSKDDGFLNVWAQDEHQFRTGAAQLEVACHIPVFDHSVVGFLVNGNTIRSGDLQLVGTRGVCIDQNDNVFTIHYTGEPLYDRYKQGNSFVTPRAVQRIIFEVQNNKNPLNNTQITAYPDKNGVISIISQNIYLNEDALRLKTENSSLRIELAAG